MKILTSTVDLIQNRRYAVIAILLVAFVVVIVGVKLTAKQGNTNEEAAAITVTTEESGLEQESTNVLAETLQLPTDSPTNTTRIKSPESPESLALPTTTPRPRLTPTPTQTSPTPTTAIESTPTDTVFDAHKDSAPAAMIKVDINDYSVGEKITFDGNSSFGFHGQLASYEWDFGDGSKGNGVMASHSYSAAGQYDVSLTVKDGTNNLTDTATTFVTIVTVKSISTPTLAPTPTSISIPTPTPTKLTEFKIEEIFSSSGVKKFLISEMGGMPSRYTRYIITHSCSTASLWEGGSIYIDCGTFCGISGPTKGDTIKTSREGFTCEVITLDAKYPDLEEFKVLEVYESDSKVLLKDARLNEYEVSYNTIMGCSKLAFEKYKPALYLYVDIDISRGNSLVLDRFDQIYLFDENEECEIQDVKSVDIPF